MLQMGRRKEYFQSFLLEKIDFIMKQHWIIHTEMCSGARCAYAKSWHSHKPSFQILPLDGKWENALAVNKNVTHKPRYSS